MSEWVERNADIYFVARFKDGHLLFLTHGPFIESDEAKIVCDKQEGRRCYSEVVKTSLPFEVVEFAE